MRNRLKRFFLYHPLGILALTILTSDVLGGDIIASLAIWLSDQNYAGIFAYDGMYGTVSGISDTWVVIRRIFGIGSWVIIYVPYTFFTLVVWAIVSLRAGRLVTCLTRRQRWAMVLAMLTIPAFGFVFELSRLPQMILFAGPLNGFHPLTPVTKAFFATLAPLIFWGLVGRKWDAMRAADAEGNEKHPYELYLELGDLEHRRTRVRSPKTNGFVERFNRTVLDEFFRVKMRETCLTTASKRCRPTSTHGWCITTPNDRIRDTETWAADPSKPSCLLFGKKVKNTLQGIARRLFWGRN